MTTMLHPDEIVFHGGPRGESSDRSIELDASTNVNAYGPAAVVVEAFTAAAAELSQYPDPRSLAVRRMAAAQWGRPLSELAFGAGTSELLPAAMAVLARRGAPVLLAAPLYGEYARAARLAGAIPLAVTHPLAEQPPTTEALITSLRKSAAPLLVLAAPGNPLGDARSPDELCALADAAAHLGARIILDQSYDAFLDHPLGDPALGGHPATLHLRSLTKEHAIPGIRAGFAIGPPDIITRLEATRAPWSASGPAQAAALATFHPDAVAHVRDTTRRLRADARGLADALRTQGVMVRTTDVHWVLCAVANAAAAAAAAEARGIRIRPLTDHRLPSWVRVTAGLPAHNRRLISLLPEVHRRETADAETP